MTRNETVVNVDKILKMKIFGGRLGLSEKQITNKVVKSCWNLQSSPWWLEKKTG